jgi:hypothetical protein
MAARTLLVSASIVVAMAALRAYFGSPKAPTEPAQDPASPPSDAAIYEARRRFAVSVGQLRSG